MNYFSVTKKNSEETYTSTSIKYRLYPTKDQEKWLEGIGTLCREAYNLLVSEFIKGKETYPPTSMKQNKILYNFLKTREEFREIPSIIIENICASFLYSLKRFYDGAKKFKAGKIAYEDMPKPPSFKKNRHTMSFGSNSSHVQKSCNINFINQRISFFNNLLKKKNIKTGFKFKAHKKFNNAIPRRISFARDSSFNWYVSITFELPDVEIAYPERSTDTLGIDLNIKDLAVLSTGQKFQHNIERIKELESKVNKLNKSISRKRRINKDNFWEHKNYIKALKQKSKVQTKITNLRRYNIEYFSKVIAKKNYDSINMEDMNINFMIKKPIKQRNKNEASPTKFKKAVTKAATRVGMGMFRDTLKRKAIARGTTFNLVDPKNTTKMCSSCGELNHSLTLKHRVWICSFCGEHHDRDVNAAKNIRKSSKIIK